MKISGLQKTTLLDFPGHVAATVFTGGCNMRCPFCHNMDIVTGTDSAYTVDEILSFLKKRKGILDGICITGGEPTLQNDLPDFISAVKSLGYLVKLDTNGTNPLILRSLISSELVDYVAMDIKSSPSEYSRVCGIKGFNIAPVLESISVLKDSEISYEFRTTVISCYHSKEIFDEIGTLIKGCKAYYLQPFVDSQFVPDHELASPTDKELIAYRNQLLKYIPNVEIRGLSI